MQFGFFYYLRGDDNLVIENKPYKHMKRLLTFYLLLCAICVAQAQLRVLPKGTILRGGKLTIKAKNVTINKSFTVSEGASATIINL